jgi:hypothetical protein
MTTMQPGDSLWPIARRFYGDGEHETRLFEANDGQVQPYGWARTHDGVICPDWIQRLPDAARVSGKSTRRRSERNDDGVGTEIGRTLIGLADPVDRSVHQ